MLVRTGPACPLTLLTWLLGALTLAEPWLRYRRRGGDHGPDARAAYLDGAAAWSDAEHDVPAPTLNEGPWDLGLPGLVPLRADESATGWMDQETEAAPVATAAEFRQGRLSGRVGRLERAARQPADGLPDLGTAPAGPARRRVASMPSVSDPRRPARDPARAWRR